MAVTDMSDAPKRHRHSADWRPGQKPAWARQQKNRKGRRAMKQKLTIIMAVCLFVTLVFQPCSVKKAEAAVSLTSTKTAVKHTKTPVSKHGRLKVKGTKLVDKNGKAVQLQGVSSHGINWDVGEPFVNEAALKTLRDKWGANCFRVAMYTEDYNGYCVTDAASRKKLLKTIDIAVKAGKKLGMYVIIDWHVLNDQTPKKHHIQRIDI